MKAECSVSWLLKKIMMMTSSSQVVKVQREKLEACMTCPICNELFREATTISECLHTCKSFSLILGSDFMCYCPSVDMGALFLRKTHFLFLVSVLGSSKFTFSLAGSFSNCIVLVFLYWTLPQGNVWCTSV